MTEKAKDLADVTLEGTRPADPADASVPIADADSGVRKATLRLVGEDDADQFDKATAQTHAESALIGALLWSGTYAEAALHPGLIQDLLEPAAFTHAACRVIFTAIVAQHIAKLPCDSMSVHAALASRNEAQTAGGIEYLDKLVTTAPPASEAQLRGYAERIRDAWLRRRMIDASRDCAKSAQAGRSPLRDAIAVMRKRLDDLELADSAGAQLTSSAQAVERIVAGKDQPVTVRKMRTGIRLLDWHLRGGIGFGKVTVIAARTGVGKSALAAQVAKGIVTLDDTIGGLYISLEMEDIDIASRLISIEAHVEADAQMTPAEAARYAAATQVIHRLPLFYATCRKQTCADIEKAIQRARSLLQKAGRRLGFVVVDHLGLIHSDDERSDRKTIVSRFTKWLAHTAEKNGCALLVLAQIGRAAETQGKDTTPRLHHIAESTTIEQDADNVVLIHREWDGKKFTTEDATVIVAKARNGGRKGSFTMNVDQKFYEFVEPPQIRLEAASRTHVQNYYGDDAR